MPNARLAEAADLTSLLELYRVAEVSASAEPLARAERSQRQGRLRRASPHVNNNFNGSLRVPPSRA